MSIVRHRSDGAAAAIGGPLPVVVDFDDLSREDVLDRVAEECISSKETSPARSISWKIAGTGHVPETGVLQKVCDYRSLH